MGDVIITPHNPVPPLDALTAGDTLAAVRAQLTAHITPDNGPQLVRDWDYLDEPRPWAIVWEQGPDDWAYDYVTEKRDTLPPGVGIEAATMWALSLYPDN